MKLAVGKETRDAENRVALSPDAVKKLIALGFDIQVEKGAGLKSDITDAAFEQAGATVVEGETLYNDADVVLCVRAPDAQKIQSMKKGAVLVGLLSPYQDADLRDTCAKAGVTAAAMELVPRITRAQSMDVLSSQANLAGYRAVVEAAYEYGHAFPLMMTAAGTVPPAKVFVMGAGVAGLQAIATARRLGGAVSATDVRPAAREQVQSLGAKFVMVETEETKAAETAGGYAREMSDDYKKQQAALVAETIAKQDVVITTALIPGRQAPVLVTEDMIKSMKAGSVIVDLAVEQGGNCALSKAGEVVEVNGVKIIGHLNMPARIAADASSLYARNLVNYLTPLVEAETKSLKLDFEDEIVAATVLTHDGAVVHPSFKEA